MKSLVFGLLLLLTPSFVSAADAYGDALKQAQKERKYVFVFLTMKTCGPCQQMKSTTLIDGKVKEDLKDYIQLQVDIDSNPRIYQKFQKAFNEQSNTPYRVNGVPSYFLVDPFNNKVIRWATGVKDVLGFRRWLRTNEQP